MNAIDTQTEAEIRADERRRVADRIAHDLAVMVCALDCEHPSCATYRYAARTARKHGDQPVRPPLIPTQPARPPFIPSQPGSPE